MTENEILLKLATRMAQEGAGVRLATLSKPEQKRWYAQAQDYMDTCARMGFEMKAIKKPKLAVSKCQKDIAKILFWADESSATETWKKLTDVAKRNYYKEAQGQLNVFEGTNYAITRRGANSIKFKRGFTMKLASFLFARDSELEGPLRVQAEDVQAEWRSRAEAIMGLMRNG